MNHNLLQGMETILGRAGEIGQVRVFGEAVEVLCAEGKAAAALRLEELGNIVSTKTPLFCVVCIFTIYAV